METEAVTLPARPTFDLLCHNSDEVVWFQKQPNDPFSGEN